MFDNVKQILSLVQFNIALVQEVQQAKRGSCNDVYVNLSRLFINVCTYHLIPLTAAYDPYGGYTI